MGVDQSHVNLGWIFDTSKIDLPPASTVVFTIYRSKKVVLVFFVHYVASWLLSAGLLTCVVLFIVLLLYSTVPV